MYSEIETRYPQLIAVSQALKKALESRLPKDLNGKLVPVQTYKDLVPVNNALDDPELVEFSVPSIVVMQPEFIPFKHLNNNRPLYRDFDYINLEAREFPEPIHGKLRFPVHTIAGDPDNDLILQTFMQRLTRTLCEVNAKIYPDSEQYDRVVLYWREPTDYASEDSSRIRVYPVDAWVNIELLEYKKVRLISPDTPVEFTDEGSTGFYTPFTLAQTVSESSIIVYVTESTVRLPLSGIGVFEDGSMFSYTGKTPDSFTGVTGIVGYHFFGERVLVR
jgi:hypothetical protein